MSFELELVSTPTDEAVKLVNELEAELSGDFSARHRHGYSIARIFEPNILLFIASVDGNPVGCGGIAFEEGFAEVKRMYVRPEYRGRKIGQKILARLEEEACARGVTRLMLETGDVLRPAIRLYENAGFSRCGVFGAYAQMPPAAIERSVFMQKQIDSGRAVRPTERDGLV